MPSHHPPHIYLDNTWYIITASTVDHARFLCDDLAKELVRDKLKDLVIEFDIQLRAWVILDNHYHVLLHSSRAKDLSRFIGRLHGSTSRQISLWASMTGRQVWHNYWDTCIRDETGLWTRFNYIHHNPVRRGYVDLPVHWLYSSARNYEGMGRVLEVCTTW